MMITGKIVSEMLLHYLNGEVSLAELVDRAENSVGFGIFEPDEDVKMLMDLMMYLAGADTDYFPLTWEVCADFMRQLGTPVKVVPA